MTNDIAPLIQVNSPPRHYSPTGRVQRAWQVAWDLMRARPGVFIDAYELATPAAESQGLATATMIGVLTRKATAGELEKTHVITDGTRGPRKRTQYRIPQS